VARPPFVPGRKPGELGNVIKLVGRCPTSYPPGTLDALKGRRYALPPEPVASISTSRVASGRPAARIKADAEHMRRAHERRLARLRVRTDQSGVADRIVRAAGTFG
jgi:hypothetical protein